MKSSRSLFGCIFLVCMVCGLSTYLLYFMIVTVSISHHDDEVVKKIEKREMFAKKNNDDNNEEADEECPLRKIHKEMIKIMTRENIDKNSREYSKYPHPPGSSRNAELAHLMAKQWKKFGMDRVEMFTYKLLLSQPVAPAEIHLFNGNRLENKLVIENEPPFAPSENKGVPIFPFNAYSVSGNISGEIVYCNYGLPEDYDSLKKLEIEVRKKIHLIRYGAPTSRGELVGNAVKYGAIGVIFYSDPREHTFKGEEYPKGWMLNNFGIQRGSIWNTYHITSDALSIGYPSKPHYFRAKTIPEDFLLPIPSQPVSAQTASQIFNFMRGKTKSKTPDYFKGNMNITYRLQSRPGQEVQLQVNNELKDKESLVVCATIFGKEEPDRYILIGNHRDAWVYGAADPVSGSAVMTELVHALGQYRRRSGFRPRRSIMVCSWGAEEAGVQGSTEWAYENLHFLQKKVIAYLNVDQAVEGNYTLSIKSQDQMIDAIFQAAKMLKPPDSAGKDISMYEDLRLKQQHIEKKNFSRAQYRQPNAGSDDFIFTSRFGIPVSDYRYTYNKLEMPPKTIHYSHYHTRYDSYDWMKKFVDPGFQNHLKLGQLWLTHALILATSDIIPFDLVPYVTRIKNNFKELKNEHKYFLQQNDISTCLIDERIDALDCEARKFMSLVKKLSTKKKSVGYHILRAINDKLAGFEKIFILESNSGVLRLKNVVNTFGPIRYTIKRAISYHGRNDKLNDVRKEITLLTWCIDIAIRSLDLSNLSLKDNED